MDGATATQLKTPSPGEFRPATVAFLARDFAKGES